MSMINSGDFYLLNEKRGDRTPGAIAERKGPKTPRLLFCRWSKLASVVFLYCGLWETVVPCLKKKGV